MPQFDTGTSWDQGLNALGTMLFPDPSKIAQAGYYGAMQRNQRLEGDLKERQLGGRDKLRDIFARSLSAQQPGPSMEVPPVAPPTAAIPDPGALVSAFTGGAPPNAAAPLEGAFTGGSMPAPATPAPIPDPNALAGAFASAGPSPSAPPVDTDAMIQGFVGQTMARAAQPNGSPVPQFDIGEVVQAASEAGYDGPQLQAVVGGAIARAVSAHALSQEDADKYMLALNPPQAGQMMTQKYVTGNEMVNVWDKRTNTPTQITHDQVIADGGQNYRVLNAASADKWTDPQRFYDPKNPGASITAPMFEGAKEGGVQVTQNGVAETTGGLLAGGRAPTRQQIEAITGAQTLTTAPSAYGPEDQARNRQIDDGILQKAFPPTGNRTDANMPVMLDDPGGEIAARTDQLQRENLPMRNNRALAYTQALKEFKDAGRLSEPNRATTLYGRNAPGVLTGQVGANADVVMVDVKGKNGMIKQPRLKIRVLPAGQRVGGGAGQPGPTAAPPRAAGAMTTAAPPVSAAPAAAPSAAASSAFTPPPAAKLPVPGGGKSGAAATVPMKVGKATYNRPDNFPGWTPKSGVVGPKQWNPMAVKPSAQQQQQPMQRGSRMIPEWMGGGPAATPQTAAGTSPQAQMPQGQPVDGPDGMVFGDKTTGQIMVVYGGMAYPASNDQIAAFQASRR